ncbi:DUF1501 domain-containing protein [Rugosimonospora acidiphila]|uniref:DUF1501 domain-containing protein n=1 Tax=Rugosimonospora acidiphila TaxID=556531 RepID=A0ABP9RSJ6_9ACTN
MDALTRRRFLRASGVVGAAALATGGAVMGLAELLGTATNDQPAWTRQKVSRLVLVTLYGGNDGLNTVIPYADPAYHSARPELAYPPEQVLHLDASLGLNPAMRRMKQAWDNKRLAIVLGVEYPSPNRSHFRSMDIWQSATPTKPATTGWIGRWLDGTKASREVAVSFEPVLPPVLAGQARVGSCISYQGFSLPTWIDAATVSALGRPQAGEPEMQARAANSYADLVTMEHVIGGADKPAGSVSTDDGVSGPATGTGGDSEIAGQLELVARCVEVGVPTRVYSVSLGGFDLHADERDAHQYLLGQLDSALGSFLDRMARTEAGRQVVVVVYSEFGRRVRANASDGTDHGTAAPILVAGARVAGGFYGEQPSLTDLDDGDLKASTDFRDVYGTVLATVLRADPERYLDGFRPHLLPLFPPG